MLRWRRSQRDQGKTEQVRETCDRRKDRPDLRNDLRALCKPCNACFKQDQTGVSANVSLKGKRAVVSYDREIDVNVLKKAVEDAGYTVESIS